MWKRTLSGARRRLGGPLGLCACAAALVACGRAAERPRWVALADGYAPPPLEDVLARWREGGAAREGGLVLETGTEAGSDGVWARTSVRADDWTAEAALPGEWRAPRPLAVGFLGPLRFALEIDGRAVEEVTDPEKRRDPTRTEPEFLVQERALRLRLAPGAAPPAEARFSTFFERGRAVGGTWRAVAERLSGDGLTVWPGERAEVVVDLPARSALRTTPFVAFLDDDALARATFRVFLDGELLDEVVLDGARTAQEREIALPRRGRAGARLAFEVDGPQAVSAFFAPVVGPAETGDYRARPFEADRPDVILFLLDTFRADNLAAWGGDPEHAPHLNALAARSVRFSGARSPSTWTLPAHTSMFTGLFPPQHGATDQESRASGDLATLAEELASLGYRTGAVTDAAYLSRSYGLDQGFEWFEEYDDERDFERTVRAATAFLDRDDGRPFFLFVHTYRAHSPYRTGVEEDRRAWDQALARNRERVRAWDGQSDPLLLARAFGADLEALYRRGVRALDEVFARFLEALESRGLDENAYLVVTSDHGEAFYEHGYDLHNGKPYEELVRVPFFVHGPGLEPRDVPWAMTLVDVPRTIAELAVFQPRDDWIGASALSLSGDRPVFSFNVHRGTPWLSIVDRQKKIVTHDSLPRLSEGDVDEAFDLAVDPDERANLVEDGGAVWPAELGRRLAPLVETLSRELVESERMELSGSLRQQLAELGYTE